MSDMQEYRVYLSKPIDDCLVVYITCYLGGFMGFGNH